MANIDRLEEGEIKSAQTSEVSSEDASPTKHEFNEQTHYVPKSTIITVSLLRTDRNLRANRTRQIFLACASVDLLALMDQTTLAASLTIVSNSLHAGDEQAWIASGYFVYAEFLGVRAREGFADAVLQNFNVLPVALRSSVGHLVQEGNPAHRSGMVLLRISCLVAGPDLDAAHHLPCVDRCCWWWPDDDSSDDCQ